MKGNLRAGATPREHADNPRDRAFHEHGETDADKMRDEPEILPRLVVFFQRKPVGEKRRGDEKRERDVGEHQPRHHGKFQPGREHNGGEKSGALIPEFRAPNVNQQHEQRGKKC